MADHLVDIQLLSAEKRRDDGKYYAYRIEVQYESGKKVSVWRRYKQMDALRETMMHILQSGTVLPKLTSKIYLKRSSVRQVAEHRMPKLQRFLGQLLTFQKNVPATKTLHFFLIPTASDIARAQLPDPDDVIMFHTKEESKMARVLWSYQATSPDDLSIAEGDIVRIISKSEGWVLGELNGEQGNFPEEFVKEITEEDEEEPEPKRGPQAAGPRPSNATEELRATERDYIQGLIDVRDQFFPRLRAIISAPEAKTFFNNWAELIPANQVCCSLFSCIHP
jgi:hypothetical protein